MPKKSKDEFKNLITEKLGKSKSKQVEEINESTYSVYIKIFNNESRVQHEVFSNVPEDKKISVLTEKGTRVVVAKYPSFYKIYFIEYIESGVPSYPRGGIKVYNQTFEQVQSFYYESVAIHPTKKDKCKIFSYM